MRRFMISTVVSGVSMERKAGLLVLNQSRTTSSCRASKMESFLCSNFFQSLSVFSLSVIINILALIQIIWIQLTNHFKRLAISWTLMVPLPDVSMILKSSTTSSGEMRKLTLSFNKTQNSLRSRFLFRSESARETMVSADTELHFMNSTNCLRLRRARSLDTFCYL